MKGDTGKTIYFITGASGVGKTTLITQLAEKYQHNPWSFFHFDSVGVTSLEEMTKNFGSPSRWQEEKAYEWIDKLVHDSGEKIFLEGQVNLDFIRKGCAKQNFDQYEIILLGCDEDEMKRRLDDRGQAELFTPAMRNWLRFLRNQAKELNALYINTSHLSKEGVLRSFEETIKLVI